MYRVRQILLLPFFAAICGCFGSDQDRFEGTWEPIEARRGNRRTDNQWFPFIAVDFIRDHVTFRSSGNQFRATFTLGSQKQIDILSGRSGEEETLKGIYKFEDDYKTLILCIADHDEPRPSKLEPHPDNNKVMYIKLIRRAPAKSAQ